MQAEPSERKKNNNLLSQYCNICKNAHWNTSCIKLCHIVPLQQASTSSGQHLWRGVRESIKAQISRALVSWQAIQSEYIDFYILQFFFYIHTFFSAVCSSFQRLVRSLVLFFLNVECSKHSLMSMYMHRESAGCGRENPTQWFFYIVVSLRCCLFCGNMYFHMKINIG